MESQNPWWYNEADPAYERWKRSPVRWTPPILREFEVEPFSLNFLVGPRQVGKTTALKIFINEYLLRRLDPKAVFYLSCEELLDFKELGEVIDNYMKFRDANGIRGSWVILDEITFVDEWYRAIKRRIDDGIFGRDVLIISGSASIELLRAKESFPGRRGKGKDLIFYPLSFSDYVSSIKGVELPKGGLDEIEGLMGANAIHRDVLEDAFNSYLMTGGFPIPIVELLSTGKVSFESKKVYIDWIKNDFLKLRRSEGYMKEILAYIVNSRASPVSWLSIAKETSINSPHTAQAYVEDLERLFVIKVLNLIMPDSKVAHRKNKKIHIADPFLYGTVCEYVRAALSIDTVLESTVASHLSRKYSTFYWRNKGEVDVVVLKDGRQIGIEVKTTSGSWTKPRHLNKVILLDRDKIPVFLGSLKV